MVLYLLDNPFYCSCQAARFARYIEENNIRHQFAKYEKMVCKTNNPLPNTIQAKGLDTFDCQLKAFCWNPETAEHLTQLANMEDCEPEYLYFSVYDKGSQKTIAQNVTGEYILPFGSRNRFDVLF